MATDKLVNFDHVTDYISREAAIRSIADYDDWFIDEETGEWVIKMEKAEELLEYVPAADVRPVVRGEWIDIRPINQSTFERIAIKGAYNKCSLCGRLCFFEENFCPNCGADMRGPNLDTTKGDSHD